MRPTLPTRRPIESAPIIPWEKCQPLGVPVRDAFAALMHIRYDRDGEYQPHACGIAPAVLAPLRLED